MIDGGDGDWPLLAAVESFVPSTIEFVTFLLDNGADINVVDFNLSTPLHMSVRSHNRKLTNLLLERGAKFMTNQKGLRPLLEESPLTNEELNNLTLEEKQSLFNFKENMISLKFRELNGGISCLTFPPSANFGEVAQAYAEFLSVEADTLVLVFQSRRVNPNERLYDQYNAQSGQTVSVVRRIRQ